MWGSTDDLVEAWNTKTQKETAYDGTVCYDSWVTCQPWRLKMVHWSLKMVNLQQRRRAFFMEGFFSSGEHSCDARPKVWKNLLSILWQRGPSLTDSWPVQLDQNLVQGKCEEIGKLSQQKYLPARPDGFFFVQWNLKVTMRFWRSDKSCQLGKPGEPERAGFVRPRSHGEKFFIRNGVR